MKSLSYTDFRANYAKVLSDAVNNREEVIITRTGCEPAVILALSEYESLLETAHLLRSPANARRILASIERLESGQGTQQELVED